MKLGNSHTRLVDVLGRQIVNGAIGRDGLLPREDDLVALFDVSRTTVREATKTLQALGLVITRPRIGSRIQPLSQWRLLDPMVMDWITSSAIAADLIVDMLDLREMIEPTAAALAAERATSFHREKLVKAVSALSNAQTYKRQVQADLAFHEIVLEASGNKFLQQLRPVMHALLKGTYKLSMYDQEHIKASLPIHIRVADAILAGDAETARSQTIQLLAVARVDLERNSLVEKVQTTLRLKAAQ